MIDASRAIGRVLAAARPSVWWALAAGVTLVLGSLLSILPPIFTGRIIDSLQHLETTQTFRQLGLYVGMTIAAALISLAGSYATSAFREEITYRLRLLLMGKILRARMSDMERLSFGEIANRINEDLDGLCLRFEYAFFPSISSALTLVASAVAMFALDARFAVVCIIAVTLALLPAHLAAPRYVALAKAEASNHDVRTAAIGESATLSALSLLRHPRAALRHLQRYAAVNREGRNIRLRYALLSGISSVSTTLFNLVGPVAVLALGAFLLVRHTTSVGTVVMFLMYQARLYGPFAALSNLPLQVGACGVIAKRILEIVDMQDETSGSAAFVDGGLEIDGVAIAKGDRSILHDACATISVGGHVAIVGPSGAGKSTIATLLVRLTDPSAGNIRIAGRKLHEFDLGALREAIVIVPQDPLVFDATLYDNLTCLNPDATGDAVEAAVKICRLSEVVDGLPAGYDTVLGQRGFRLSGGERQRICLARTLIARPQIVILDEALTGIDVEMEASILADIRSVRRGCTTLVITHRLHYAADLDGVVVVEGGRIVSSGTHAQACSSSAWYRSAYEQTRRPEQLVAV